MSTVAPSRNVAVALGPYDECLLRGKPDITVRHSDGPLLTDGVEKGLVIIGEQ